jgi:hypothetical protein
MRVPIRGLNFLHEEDSGIGWRRDKFFNHSSVVGSLRVARKARAQARRE